jgi:hypothetical protein
MNLERRSRFNFLLSFSGNQWLPIEAEDKKDTNNNFLAGKKNVNITETENRF